MSVSMIIRSIILVCLVAFLVYRALRRKSKEPKSTLNKAQQKALTEKQRRKEWKKQRQSASKKRDQEQLKERWEKLLLEALPSGLSLTSIMMGNLRVAVMEGGQGPGRPTVLLLHGLASDKEIWAELAAHLLAGRCQVVAPDLPGFGDSTSSTQLAYDITSQAKRIKSFSDAKNLGTVHIVGHSIGAGIAAAYACLPKSRVASITMIEPVGIRVPEASELDQLIATGENPFMMTSASDYRTLLGHLCVEPPTIHQAILASRSAALTRNPELSKSIWRDTREGEGAWVLDLLLPEIPQLCLGIFGEESKVVHAQTREHLNRRMKNAQSVSIEACGHLPMLEHPEKTASYILRFLKALQAETG